LARLYLVFSVVFFTIVVAYLEDFFQFLNFIFLNITNWAVKAFMCG